LTLADFYNFYPDFDYELALGLMELNVGEVSEIYFLLEEGDYREYAIFIIHSISVLTEDELVASAREQYESAHKVVMFAEIVDQWMKDLNHVINQRGFDAVW
jgi:hypothetical protein